MPPPAPPASTTVVATRHPPGRDVDALSPELTSQHAATAAVDAVLAAHARLPRTGKPPAGQWTPLAGFAVVRKVDYRGGVDEGTSCADPPTFQATCVALGTGSKCVGASRRSPHGDTVNDGHAEALARRALVRWLVAELGVEGGDGAFFGRVERPPQTAPFLPVHFVRSPHWALHMVTTAPPCGDASIVAGASTTGARALVVESGDDQGDVVVAAAGGNQTNDHNNHDASTHPPTTTIDVAAQAAGRATAIGAPRRKPGRGPPTLSMSCSDKLARWTVVGVQGALVGRVLAAPVYVDAVTVVGEREGGFQQVKAGQAVWSHTPTNTASSPPHGARLTALSRALVDRLGGATRALPPPFTHTPPVLHVGVVTAGKLAPAGVAPGTPGTTPAPTSTAWARVRQASGGNWEPPDVVVGATGRKAGAVKRKAEQDSASGSAPPPRGLLPAVCKRAAYERWLALVRGLGGEPPPACYGDAKRAATAYQAASAAVRGVLGGWIEKPMDLFWV